MTRMCRCFVGSETLPEALFFDNASPNLHTCEVSMHTEDCLIVDAPNEFLRSHVLSRLMTQLTFLKSTFIVLTTLFCAGIGICTWRNTLIFEVYSPHAKQLGSFIVSYVIFWR